MVYDWDDTLVGYRRFGQPGEWLDGAQDALRGLLSRGYAVTVFSCRARWAPGEASPENGEVAKEHGADTIAGILREAGFEPRFVDETDETPAGELGVWTGKGKPLGYVYVDDRAVEFGGDHETVIEILKERLPRP